ncbi:hypothetical protein BRD15_04955 [Halobacteriales archaeon SW_6_65_15]|nr:MAG: hypothetical protein BRD15_04955 [Halobacteriales archaeon SW_6_65_15]
MGADEKEHRTSRVHDEPAATMGRRRFVNTLLGLGFGALSATFLTAEDVQAAGRDEVPIVYGLARDDEGTLRPRRKEVPADWYDDFRSAVAVHRNLELFSNEDVASSAVVPGEYGGANASIHVEVTAEEARGEVPERVEETPVEVTRVEPPETTGGHGLGADGASDVPDELVSDERESDDVVTDEGGVPGSVAVASDDLYGTLAPAMRDPSDGTAYFATANHVFDGSDASGQSLYLLDGGRTQIGTVSASHPKADVAAARPESDYRPLHRIEEGEPGNVLGQFTEAGLADLKAEDEPLEKVGARTGHTEGEIQAVDGLTCAYGAICKQGQLKWGDESGFSDGDSGSVNYHPDPEDPEAGVLVGGFNNARTWWPGENYIWGTAAYHITEKHSLTF